MARNLSSCTAKWLSAGHACPVAAAALLVMSARQAQPTGRHGMQDQPYVYRIAEGSWPILAGRQRPPAQLPRMGLGGWRGPLALQLALASFWLDKCSLSAQNPRRRPPPASHIFPARPGPARGPPGCWVTAGLPGAIIALGLELGVDKDPRFVVGLPSPFVLPSVCALASAAAARLVWPWTGRSSTEGKGCQLVRRAWLPCHEAGPDGPEMAPSR